MHRVGHAQLLGLAAQCVGLDPVCHEQKRSVGHLALHQRDRRHDHVQVVELLVQARRGHHRPAREDGVDQRAVALPRVAHAGIDPPADPVHQLGGHAQVGHALLEAVGVDGDRVGFAQQRLGQRSLLRVGLGHDQHVGSPHALHHRPLPGAIGPLARRPQVLGLDDVGVERVQGATQVPAAPQHPHAGALGQPAPEHVVHMHALDRLGEHRVDVHLVAALGQPPRPPLGMQAATAPQDGNAKLVGHRRTIPRRPAAPRRDARR